jgi:ABC-2 type transport system permease protein
MSGYTIYALIIALLAVWVSAKSKNSTSSLITLIGCWVVWILVMPKLSQVASQSLYPSSSKAEFEAMVEEEIVQHGDSHNPDDPHYTALRDSLLRAYGVDAPHQIPFNYSGYVMREGERLSSEIYRQHQRNLIAIYQRQQHVVRLAALGNPFLAIKLVSMALTGTDYASYNHFQQQAEAYRYNLAQTMNELQMRHVGNDVQSSAEARGFISRQHWVDFPDFEHRFGALGQALTQEWLAWVSLLIWCGGLLLAARRGTYHSEAMS